MQTFEWEKWGGEPLHIKSDEELPWHDGLFLSIDDNGLQLPYRLSNTSTENNNGWLLVVFNAAIMQRATRVPPFFSGTRLARGYRGPVLSISDPGSHLKDVNLAWYAGTKEHPHLQKAVSELIQDLASKNNLTPLLLGSSGGGFASLAIGSSLSCDNVIIAMNPQTDFFLYHEAAVERYLIHCFGLERTPKTQKYLEDIGIITDIKSHEFPYSKILYLQNLLDSYHLTRHFDFLVESSNLKDSVEGVCQSLYWFLGPWGIGHDRVWPEHVLEILSMITSGHEISSIISHLKQQFYPEGVEINPFDEEIVVVDDDSYPHLQDLDMKTVMIGEYNFSSSNMPLNFTHGWVIIRPLISQNTLTPDLYRAIYYVLNWGKWSSANQTHPGVLDRDSIHDRIQIMQYLIKLVPQINGLIPHYERLEEMLEDDLTRNSSN